MKVNIGLFCIAVLLTPSGGRTGLRGQDGPRVEVSADPTRITVGDLVTLRVTVFGTDGGGVDFKPPGETLGPFEVRAFRTLDPSEESQPGARSAEATLSIFQTGEFKIPPLQVLYRPVDKSPELELAVPETKVVVESVKPADAADIRDIKPPLEMPRSWWSRWRWAVAAALLAAAALWFFRRRAPSPAPEPIRPVLSPYAEAYQALCRLRDEGIPEPDRAKDCYTRLSDLTRRYLQRRYGVQAMEMTSAEISRETRRAGVEEGARLLLDELLRRCDLVKFAKHKPLPGRTQDALETAFRFLELTRPGASEASASGVAGQLKTDHVSSIRQS